MRQRQRVTQPVGSTYERVMLALICTFIALVIASIVITLTVPSPETRYGLNVPNPTPPTTASPTRPPTAPPTTAAVTPAPTAPPTVAPTGAPTFPPVQLTCPDDITVTLGSSLESTFTGGAAVAVGGCTTPVIQYADSIVGTGMPSIFTRDPRKPKSFARQVREIVQGESAELLYYGDPMFPTRFTVPPPPGEAEGDVAYDKRSPSFSFSNLFLSSTQSTLSAAEGAEVAVSPDYVVWTTQVDGMGSFISVLDRELTSVTGSFLLSSLAAGNCSADSNDGGVQLVWDHEAQRWLIAHRGGNTSSLLCLYMSTSNDPMGPYQVMEYANIEVTPFFQLAVWGRTYVITMDESVAPIPASPLCVMDRLAVLANTSAPGLFCAPALNPLTYKTRWTPVHAAAHAPLANSSESSGAGTPGAVFMRTIDDEYQFGETITPMTDQFEIEHWYNLNWTTATYGAVRYKFSVTDFSQVPGQSCGLACVPTPTSTFLNASVGILMPKLTYRRIPATGQESVVAVFTSHSNDNDIARFHWVEIRWASPTINTFEPIWIPHQQGTSSTLDGLHKFLPSACMDANGTIAIGYSVSNNATTYPSLWASSRLGNDPAGTLRDPIMLHEGALGSIIPGAPPVWGPYWNMVCDPLEARWIYFSGAVSDLSSTRVTWLDRMRVLGEIVERRWRADDYCGSHDNCTQYITTV
jgi:hypothetical protein